MRNKSALLCGAALGVLLGGGLGASANAKTAKHHHAHAAPAQSVLESKVETLTAAVSDLEVRLNEETQARQALQAQAQAAQADAASAKADAASAHEQLAEQIQTIPGSVKGQIDTAIAANKPKPSWADNTKLGATVFADVSGISQTPRPNKINGGGADIKRAYFSIDHTFNDIYSANLTIDLAPNGIFLNGGTFGTGTLQGDEVIKYAYVQAKYANEAVLQLGTQKDPWIPFVEDIYGYRFVDKVMIDQNKYGNSADTGLGMHGDFGKGLFDYSLLVSDGSSYKTPVRSDGPDFEGRVNFNWNGLVVAGGGYVGRLSNEIEGSGVPTQQASREDVLVAYVQGPFRFGAEWFQANNWKTVNGAAAVAAVPASYSYACTGPIVADCTVKTIAAVAAIPATPPKPDRAQGYSFFGSYIFMPQWSVFARYDGEDPSQILAPKEHYDLVNVGVDYQPMKTVDLALVYKHEDITHAAKGGYADYTTTLAPTSTGTTHTSGSQDEVGIFTQFKF